MTTSAPASPTIDLDLLNLIDVIEAMVDLRIQLEQIELSDTPRYASCNPLAFAAHLF